MTAGSTSIRWGLRARDTARLSPGPRGSFVEVDRLTGYAVDGALKGTVELRLFMRK